MGRFIGLDIHHDFTQIAAVEDGLVADWGRVDCRPQALREFAAGLRPDDQVALEATGNASTVAVLLEPYVVRVAICNPVKTRAIAEAKVKTDKVDARNPAQVLSADFLPGTWPPDERIRMLRRLSAHRAQLVRGRMGVKNQVSAVLHRNMLPRPPVTDLFATRGRAWLEHQTLPADERQTVGALLRQLDFYGAEIAEVERRPAAGALDDPVVRRLMTIPRVDAMTAVTVLAAVGDFHRFTNADELVSYPGVNPRVRQSGGTPAHHGRITKARLNNPVIRRRGGALAAPPPRPGPSTPPGIPLMSPS
ncbi:IS110 family transposase [Streptomyces mirabilis]|uniref:IS110 family transposase n=1 Tax=Streptomyces mirabilis TaxID=68239 RepID=UPI00332DC2C2